jgi:hypothetical protein
MVQDDRDRRSRWHDLERPTRRWAIHGQPRHLCAGGPVGLARASAWLHEERFLQVPDVTELATTAESTRRSSPACSELITARASANTRGGSGSSGRPNASPGQTLGSRLSQPRPASPTRATSRAPSDACTDFPPGDTERRTAEPAVASCSPPQPASRPEAKQASPERPADAATLADRTPPEPPRAAGQRSNVIARSEWLSGACDKRARRLPPNDPRARAGRHSMRVLRLRCPRAARAGARGVGGGSVGAGRPLIVT